MISPRLGRSSSASARPAPIFELRSAHTWPPTVTVGGGWTRPYLELATGIGFHTTDVAAAAEAVRRFIAEIDRAR